MSDNSFDRIPDELIRDILKRGELHEIEGLCRSDKSFMSKCNELALREIQDRYKNNMFNLYLDLQELRKYSVMFIPKNIDQDWSYATVSNKDELKRTLEEWLAKLEPGIFDRFNTSIAFNVDNMKRPRFVLMHLGNTTDELFDANIVIQGPLKDMRTVNDLVNFINDTLDEKNEEQLITEF